MPETATDSHVPPGWDYNPGTWSQRIPLILLALTAFAISVYLTLYQYERIDGVWEPLFGGSPDPGENSSEFILTSELSFPLKRIHPSLMISDGALGSFAYLLEACAGSIGGTGRWRTMPWVVMAFAFLVISLALVSVFLTVAQPVVYGQWCTLCLVSAVTAVLMVGPAMGETLASCQFLRRVKDAPGVAFWKTFWGRGEWNRAERA